MAAAHHVHTYRDEMLCTVARWRELHGRERKTAVFSERRWFCQRYAWAIPSAAALDLLARHAPLIEIGAGGGYWAALLRAVDVDVVAYDNEPPALRGGNGWHNGDGWTVVEAGGPERLVEHPDRTLLLCWPPTAEPMASQSLTHFTGKVLIYVGELGARAATGDPAFHRALRSQWQCIEKLAIPTWPGCHDQLWVFRRRSADEVPASVPAWRNWIRAVAAPWIAARQALGGQ